jgi:hypothetical protein
MAQELGEKRRILARGERLPRISGSRLSREDEGRKVERT